MAPDDSNLSTTVALEEAKLFLKIFDPTVVILFLISKISFNPIGIP